MVWLMDAGRQGRAATAIIKTTSIPSRVPVLCLAGAAGGPELTLAPAGAVHQTRQPGSYRCSSSARFSRAEIFETYPQLEHVIW